MEKILWQQVQRDSLNSFQNTPKAKQMYKNYHRKQRPLTDFAERLSSLYQLFHRFSVVINLCCFDLKKLVPFSESSYENNQHQDHGRYG